MQALMLTGENFIPGLSPIWHEDDHLARYRFAQRLARDLKVLDIACGPGYGTKMLAEAGAHEVVGVDISAPMIEYAKSNYSSPNAKYLQGSIYDFQNGTLYDLITSFETIEHVPEYGRALANLYSLLRPGGTILISSPDRRITSPRATCLSDKPDNPFHTQEFTVSELVELVEREGFVVLEVFGQRQQRLFRNPIVRKVYRMIFKPHLKSSSNLSPLKPKSVPRYFVLRAVKPGIDSALS